MAVRRSLGIFGVTLAAASWLIGATPAMAAAPINGCAEGVYYVLAGSTHTVSFADCAGFPDTHYWNSDGTSPLAGGALSYDVSVAPGNMANTWVGGYTPTPDPEWPGQADQLIFVCGEDWATVTGAGTWPDWINYMANAQTTYLCSADSSAPPPSWFQAYGLHAGEACEAGWTAGWAEWPNDGRGGPVCNRETYFDIDSGVWSTR